jgi:hypothetical protein
VTSSHSSGRASEPEKLEATFLEALLGNSSTTAHLRGMPINPNAAGNLAVNPTDSVVLILPENCARVLPSMQYSALCREALFF